MSLVRPDLSDEIITFAVAQLPFENPSPGGTTTNVFCTLVPLWHEDWEPATASGFPNNGLVWWKVRSQNRALAVPGLLLSGRVEPAPRYVENDPTKQLYQVVSVDVAALPAEEGIEVLTANPRLVTAPGDLLNISGVLETDHPPTSEVLVRLDGWLYGPFRTRVTASAHGLYRVSLDPVSTQSIVHRLVESGISSAILRRENVIVSRDSHPPTRSIGLAQLTYEVLDADSIAEFRRRAEPVFMQRDRDLLQAAATRFFDAGERQRLADLLAQLDQSVGPEFPTEHTLIEALSREARQRAGSVRELARSLLATGLLNDHVEAAVSAQASEEVSRRSSELEAQARGRNAELLSELETLELRHQTLDDEIRTRLREAETLAQQRIEAAWAEHTRQVTAERAQLDAQLARARGWEAPPFVLAARESEPLEERAFVERFVDHVEGSGFVYRDIDLQMFHIAMKSSELVLVTGAPGAGKSSLAELYAEALAASDLRGADPQQSTRLLRVATRATWLETADLLGQINPVSNAFLPASTGVYTHLIAASEEYARHREASGIWPIVIDDVEQAPMHVWFADFLQAMRGARRQRTVRVFSPHSIDAESQFRSWPSLDLSPAVRWVATFRAGPREPESLAADFPTIRLRPEDDLHGSGASRGAPEGKPVHLRHIERWTGDGPLGPGQVAALDAIQPDLERASVPIAPATLRLMRRMVTGAQQLLSADAAFDYVLAVSVLHRLPLESALLSRILDLIEDLQIRLPESARVLEERRRLAEEQAL
ncbi:MAG: hypothetical protein WEE89_22475 [Gemmatimonadota bacterium]